MNSIVEKDMEKIYMVDLYHQYKKIKTEIDEALENVICKSSFINGEDVREFGAKLQSYLQVEHVIPCANGTDALQAALMSLNLNSGDEVIVPSFTFISPVEVIALLGFTPVFVDIDERTFNMDVGQVKNSITEKTRAIIAVHLYGQCSNMEELLSISKKNNLYLIEDNAQAIGAEYFFTNKERKKAGTIGHIGCTSFFPSKNLGCFGDGGAICTNDEKIARELKSIVNHGAKKKYYHDRIGINSRLDTMQAAILNVKLKYLDDYIRERQKAAQFYDNELNSIDGIETPLRISYSSHIFHQYTIKVKNGKRDELKAYLQGNNIPSMVYYPKPLHQQEAFLSISKTRYKLEVSEQVCNEVLSLPMHTELTEEQLAYITQSIKKFFN